MRTNDRPPGEAIETRWVDGSERPGRTASTAARTGPRTPHWNASISTSIATQAPTVGCVGEPDTAIGGGRTGGIGCGVRTTSSRHETGRGDRPGRGPS